MPIANVSVTAPVMSKFRFRSSIAEKATSEFSATATVQPRPLNPGTPGDVAAVTRTSPRSGCCNAGDEAIDLPSVSATE